MGRKDREDKGGGRAGPSGPLEVFQRALLYLIKASQAPGNTPRPAIFLHFLQSRAGILRERAQQRYIFASLEKPPVLSLQNLIVRDIANQERGMFLISDSSPPEMYELHAASKEDKKMWMCHIQHTVSKCPSREEFPLIETEYKAHLRRLKADLQQKDKEMLELLQERVTLFSELAELTCGQGGLQLTNTRYLFRADTPQAPRAEKLLMDATSEVDRLSELLLGSRAAIPPLCQHHHTDVVEACDQYPLINGTYDLTTEKETYQRLVNLSVYLHALQAAVIKQDTILELLLQPEDNTVPAVGEVWHPLRRDSGNREICVGSAIGELALLQRQHSLLKEELVRLRDAESRFKDSERARAKLERQVRNMKVYSGASPASQQIRETAPQLHQGGDISTRVATHQPVHLEGLQDGSDLEVEMTSDDDDDDGTASGSSKDLQDIPEEI